MTRSSVELYFPTFAPWVRSLLLLMREVLQTLTEVLCRPRWRARARLSIRGLIILVLVLGGGLGWVVRHAQIQHDAVAAIRGAGGSVWYNWQWKNGRPDLEFNRMWPTPERPRRHMMEAELKQ